MERHNTATVLVVTQETPKRVLLVYHKKLHVWIPPGGHVESDENPHEAAIREVLEETGLDIVAFMGKPVRVDDVATSWPLPIRMHDELIPAHGDKPEHIHVDHIYLAVIPFQEVKHDPNESNDIRWIGEDEMGELEMYENCRVLVKEIFRNSPVNMANHLSFDE